MTEPIQATEGIEKAIRLYKGRKVILDFDLAALYGIATRNLNKAVARNRERFPEDFMLSIPTQEVARLMFQFGTSKPSRGGRRKPAMAFTQEGVSTITETY